MACDVNKILNNISNIIDRVVLGQALSISKLGDNSFTIKYGDTKIKTRDQAYRVAQSKVNSVNKRLALEGFPETFGPYVTIDTSNSDSIVIHKLPLNKLSRAYNLRNQAEQEDRDLNEYIEDIRSQEDLSYATQRAQNEEDNNLMEYVLDIDLENIPGSEFDKIINQRKALLSALRSQLKRTKEYDQRNVVKDRIKRVKEQIDQLENKDVRTFDLILQMAKSDLQVVNNMIDQNNNTESIGYMTGLISNYSSYLIDTFGNIIDDLNDTERSDFNELISNLQSMSSKVIQKQLQIANDKVKSSTGKEFLNINGVPLQYKDIGIGAEWALDSTQINHPIVQSLTKLITDAQKRADLSAISFKTKNQKLVKALKDYQTNKGLKGDQIYDFMIQTDKNGKRTKKYVDEYTNEYYELRDSQIDTPQDKFTFYVNNHDFKFNQEAWNTKLESDRKFFIDNKADEITLTDIDINKGISLEEKIESEFQKFIAPRDAQTMFGIFQEAKRSGITNQHIKYFTRYVREGNLHAVKVGEEMIYPIEFKALDKWIDPKWTAIQNMSSTDPRKQFYNHFIDNITRAYRKVSSQDHWLDWSYIPEKTKTSKMGNLRDYVVKSISQNVSRKQEIIDPFLNEIKKNIPVYMTGNSLAIEDRSFNLGDILTDFMAETSRFEQMNSVEDDVNFLLAALKKIEVFQTNIDGSPKIVDGIVQTKKGEDSSIYKVARYRVDAQLYGEAQAIEGKTGLKVETSKEKKRKEELTKQLGAINLSEQDRDTALSFIKADEPYTGDNPNIGKFVELGRELNSMQNSTRVITGTRIGNALMSFTQLRFLGFNAFAGFGELIQGFYSLNLASAGEKWFTGSNLTKAMGEVVKSMNPGSTSKIKNLSKYFQTYSETIMGTDIQRNKLTDAAFIMYRGANYLVNNSYLVAMLINKKIKDKSEIEHSLYDVLNISDEGIFSLNGDFNQTLYTEDNQPTPYLLSIIQDYEQMIKLNRDRKSSKDPIKMDSTFLGRAVGQFKKNWMINGFLTRFQDYRESNLYYGDRKGFYRSVFDLFKPPLKTDILGNQSRDYSAKSMLNTTGRAIKELMKYSFFGKLLGSTPNEELSELDIQNLKMFMREMTWGLSLFALTALCSAMIGDNDDDENLPFYRYVLNQSTRLLRDVTTYASPSSFMSITKNPMPFMSTIKDVFDLGTKVVKTPLLMSPSYDYSDWNIFKSVENLTPGVRQVRQTYNKINRTIQYNE